MANTTLSSIGGVLQDPRGNELIVTGIADGTAKAGDTVCILDTNAVRQTDVDGNLDEFIGILLPHHKVDMDTAITAALPVRVVIPQGGHLYGVHTDTDQGTESGEPMVFHATTAGILDEGGDIEAEHIARKFSGDSGDTYLVVIWS